MPLRTSSGPTRARRKTSCGGTDVADNEASLGTRFLLYPQSPSTPGYDKPELVWISAPQGSILPGPANDRMYVVDPTGHKDPYEYPYLPPYNGHKAPPVEPSPDGHFDHIDPDSRAFLGVHLFGCIARVLDIWEGYMGRRIPWHFADSYERLEIIPMIEWDNAQSGWGMLEFGYKVMPDNRRELYALNFDVIAHELGHSILFSELGLPQDGLPPGPHFFAYHESIADLCSLISMLHFDTAADRLLRRGRGNLLAMNELNRVAELGDERQIRIAGNARKLSEVSQEVHDHSRPFTGGVFDTIVQTYHDIAVDRGLVDLPAGSVPDARHQRADLESMYGSAFAADYEYKHFQLKEALEEARDIVANGLARSWDRLDCTSVTFQDAAYALCETLQDQGRGDVAETAMECMAWREILTPFDMQLRGPIGSRASHWI